MSYMQFGPKTSNKTNHIQLASSTNQIKGATSWFAHLEKFSLNFSSSCFVIRVNLLHPWPCLTLFALLLSLWSYLSKSWIIFRFPSLKMGGVVASWLVRSTPERAVWVRALARDTVLCSWERYFTLTVPLSTQEINGYQQIICLRITLQWTSIPSRGK